MLKADSGATKTYIRESDIDIVKNVKNINTKRNVMMPNNVSVTVSHVGTLNISPTLSNIATEASILPGLKTASLLSIGQLCDDNCNVTFDKNKMEVYKNNEKVLTGVRNQEDGLWDVPVKKVQLEKANVIIRVDKTKNDLANFIHATMFSPTIDTLDKAIRNKNLLTMPGVNDVNFRKYIGDNIPTAVGHIKQERKYLRTTKISKLDEFENLDMCPIKEEKQYCVMSSIFEFNSKEMAYGDMTGRFPFTSSRGNSYVYVMYDFDSNMILVKAVPNRQAATITAAWEELFRQLTKHGHVVSHFVLDNELSNELKKAFEKKKVKFQRVPPNIHRRNSAERAIQTFKNHLLSGLATCHSQFPIAEWDRLLPQCTITLNLLRRSRVNPKLSAYAYIEGPYDFNAWPMAPPGTKVVIHKKVNQRGSWDYRGKEGWYIGPSVEHYRCVRCYIPSTHSVIDVDTVQFLPEKIPFPMATLDFQLRQTAQDLVSLLKNDQKLNIPNTNIGDSVNNALVTLATTLGRKDPFPAIKSSHHIKNNNNLKRVGDVNLQRVQSKLPIVDQDWHDIRDRITRLQEKDRIVQKKMALIGKPSTSNMFVPVPKGMVRHNKDDLFRDLFPHGTPLTELVQHIFDENGTKLSIDKLLKGADRQIWLKGLDNELGRLANGIPKEIIGTNTIGFITKASIPVSKKVTYSNMVCDIKPLKKEKHRVRLTIGGDKLEYMFDTAAPAASLIETKLLVNSVISDCHHGARFLTLDIKDFYLQTILHEKEYMKIHSKYFSDKFRKIYSLHNKINKDGYVYCEIRKGMYGLKQAAILAYKQLLTNLKKHGYSPCEGSSGIWRHATRKTKFALCVDDFGVKYFSMDDALHLINALKSNYEISIDWKGEDYCGTKLKWNYKEKYVDMNMPGYINKALLKFQHTPPAKLQYAPARWNNISYGRKIQYAPEMDKGKVLDKKGTRDVQAKVGTFLYYGRAVDPTTLVALNEISRQQSKPTHSTLKDISILMDYLYTYPNATLRFYAGTMQLKVESDASYLVVPGAKSRVAGHFYLAAHKRNLNSSDDNAPVNTECATLKNVVCSAAEAECGGLFHNCQKAVTMRRMLEGLGHKQQPTSVKTDNSTANSFVHASMRLKKSKTWDMRWNWLRQQELHQQFRIKWEPGKFNKADLFSKLHPPSHHIKKRGDYILKGFSLTEIYNKFKHNL